MTSAIDNSFLSTINENFPVAGAFNSTQPFRDNYARIKDGFATAGKELTYLQGKKIEVIGDATGISGQLGNSLSDPTPITLTLANTAVTAGAYTTSGNVVAFTVDSKGRLTNVTSTAIPLRPAVVGTFVGAATSTTPAGTVKTLTLPTLTVDNMGTITAASNTGVTLNFGIVDHALAKGSLLVGNTAGLAKEFVAPAISYNTADLWVLAWRPDAGNDYGLKWYKLPAANPLNPALVIDVTAGPGINVSTDPAHPVVSFDYSTFTDYSAPSVDPQGSVLFHDFTTNAEYKLSLTQLFSAIPAPVDTPLYALEEDTAPKLGGDLHVGINKIIGSTNNGLVLEIQDTKPLVISHVRTYDPLDTSVPPVQMPAANWEYTEQVFPSKPPVFSAQDTVDGITQAYLKSGADGIMFWSPEPDGGESITELFPGTAITFDVPGSITTTGTINVDTSDLDQNPPDIYSDMVMARNFAGDHYQTPLASATWTMPNLMVVDPVNAAGDFVPGYGQLHAPFANITSALALIDDSLIVDPEDGVTLIPTSEVRYVLLMPGIYEESFTLNKRNVRFVSLMGADLTKVVGEITFLPGMGKTGFKGVRFDITNTEATRIFSATTGIESLEVEDCDFIRPPTTVGRPDELMRFSGVQTGAVSFNNCKFAGKIFNQLTLPGTPFVFDHWFRITNTRADRFSLLTVVNGNSATPTESAMEISGANMLQQIQHLSGTVFAKNIGAITGDWNDAVWASIDPETQSPTSTGIPPEGIVSTAVASATPHAFLSLTNVSLRNFITSTNTFIYSSLMKTGTCDYSLGNVQRNGQIDTISGGRFDNHSAPIADANTQIVKLTNQTGTVVVDSEVASFYDITASDNVTVELRYPANATVPTPGFSQATVVRVLVRQDASGGNTFTFTTQGLGAVQWISGTPPTIPTTANGMMFLEFTQIGEFCFGR